MHIGIIGYGRFGQLWAELMRQFGDVLVWSRSHEPGQISDHISFVTLQEAAAADMLFLLVPISAMEETCMRVAPLLKPETVVLDACSVKLYPVRVMRRRLPSEQQIIATHPLFGPDSVARQGVRGQSIVICPVHAEETSIDACEQMMETLGIKIIRTTADEHDKQMARSQALVHFIGRALTPLKLGEQPIATPDYHSLLQMNSMVQNDTWKLFFDMQTYNPYSAEMRGEFAEALRRLEWQIDQRRHNEQRV